MGGGAHFGQPSGTSSPEIVGCPVVNAKMAGAAQPVGQGVDGNRFAGIFGGDIPFAAIANDLLSHCRKIGSVRLTVFRGATG